MGSCEISGDCGSDGEMLITPSRDRRLLVENGDDHVDPEVRHRGRHG